jgi:hypothetical protein
VVKICNKWNRVWVSSRETSTQIRKPSAPPRPPTTTIAKRTRQSMQTKGVCCIVAGGMQTGHIFKGRVCKDVQKKLPALLWCTLCTPIHFKRERERRKKRLYAYPSPSPLPPPPPQLNPVQLRKKFALRWRKR